jgi:hypothetical protein
MGNPLSIGGPVHAVDRYATCAMRDVAPNATPATRINLDPIDQRSIDGVFKKILWCAILGWENSINIPISLRISPLGPVSASQMLVNIKADRSGARRITLPKKG